MGQVTEIRELNAEEGIRQIRQLIGGWFASEHIATHEVLGRVANVVLRTRLKCFEAAAPSNHELLHERPADKMAA